MLIAVIVSIIFNISIVEYKFVSEFVSTGINQTKHNLYLKYSVDLELITPFLDTDTVFESQVLINEMILVGDVPSTYLGIN